jgi:apolipoprotein D and lipocalin family protein
MKVFLAGILGLLLGGCAHAPRVTPAPKIDLPRFMGDWHVIANIPYFAEKDCFNSLETYRLTAEGKVDTVFTARKGGFDGKLMKATNVATVTDPGTNARWTASFFGGLIKVKLVILAVSPDYRSAAVATPDAKLAWIFSRGPTLSQADYDAAVAVLKRNGVDVSKLARVPQDGRKPQAD